MIIIHPLKIAFEDAPKVGSTSLFNWLYSLLYGKKYEPIKSGKNTQYLHGWIQAQQNEIIENQSLDNFKCPKDYLVFCLIRDPVKRLLSAYSNRVLYHKELNFSHKQGQATAIKSGLLAAYPTLNYFIEHLEDYQAIAPSIHYHTRPLVHFIGANSSIYDYIFDISEMESLRQTLLNHWRTHKLLEDKIIPEVPHLQSEGKKTSLSELSESNFKKCLKLYADDYAAFSLLNENKIRQDWQRACTEHNKTGNEPISTATIEIKPQTQIVKAHWLSKNKLAVSHGEIENFAGAIVLKAALANKYRLIASDARGEWQLKWHQPSPNIAKQYPNNPHALNARFKAQGLQIDAYHPVKIFIEDDSGKRHLFFVIAEGKN